MAPGGHCVAEGVAHVGRIRNGGDPAVAAMVDAAGQGRWLVARVLDVGAVDADRRRADEALAVGQAVGVDLAHEDLVGIEPELGHRRAQLLERLRVRRAAVPEQQLDLWLRHLPEARGRARRAERRAPGPESRGRAEAARTRTPVRPLPSLL